MVLYPKIQTHGWWSWTIYYVSGNRNAFLHEKIRNWKRHIHVRFEDISYTPLTALVYQHIDSLQPTTLSQVSIVLWMRVINLSEFQVLESLAGENYYKTVVYRSHVFILTLSRARTNHAHWTLSEKCRYKKPKVMSTREMEEQRMLPRIRAWEDKTRLLKLKNMYFVVRRLQ